MEVIPLRITTPNAIAASASSCESHYFRLRILLRGCSSLSPDSGSGRSLSSSWDKHLPVQRNVEAESAYDYSVAQSAFCARLKKPRIIYDDDLEVVGYGDFAISCNILFMKRILLLLTAAVGLTMIAHADIGPKWGWTLAQCQKEFGHSFDSIFHKGEIAGTLIRNGRQVDIWFDLDGTMKKITWLKPGLKGFSEIEVQKYLQEASAITLETC
jgi:hypothetical protein